MRQPHFSFLHLTWAQEHIEGYAVQTTGVSVQDARLHRLCCAAETRSPRTSGARASICSRIDQALLPILRHLLALGLHTSSGPALGGADKFGCLRSSTRSKSDCLLSARVKLTARKQARPGRRRGLLLTSSCRCYSHGAPVPMIQSSYNRYYVCDQAPTCSEPDQRLPATKLHIVTAARHANEPAPSMSSSCLSLCPYQSLSRFGLIGDTMLCLSSLLPTSLETPPGRAKVRQHEDFAQADTAML